MEQMAVLASESGMTSDSEDHNNVCHEFNLYVDRQLRNKLLEVDNDIELYEIKLSQSGNYQRNGAKTVNIDILSGWYSDAKLTARGNERATKIDAKPANTFILPWKEGGTKKEENFVFKHYTDYKKYIEQYSSEHGYLNSRYPSGNLDGDIQKVAFQRHVTVQQNWASPNTPLALQYSNRVKEQLGTLVSPSIQINSNYYNIKSNPADNHLSSLQHRYKLTPGHFSRTDTCSEMRNHGQSDKSSEYGKYQQRSRRSNSATSTRGPQKDPTKVSVPSLSRAYHNQALAIQQSVKQNLCPSPKPLDNLNCVALNKQGNNEDKKSLESMGFALQVHSLHDLLANQDTPLRGYVLPKSMPQPSKTDNIWFDTTGRAYMSLATRYDPIRKY